ncbi:MAG: DUF928 domain-containing protein, partial [Cyanobacteria bacterium J06649_4]
TDEAVGALTTQANPTLWFYLPTPVQESTIEFVLKGSNETVLYEGQLVGETSDSGIVGIPLPVSLQPNTAYRWYLTLVCDETERTTVDGWIERQNPGPDLTRTFSQANTQNKVALYAHYGFLQDALSELANLRLIQPDNDALDREWDGFLTALNLSDLSAAEILDCCTLAEVTEVSEPTIPETLEPDPTPETDSVETETEEEEQQENRPSIQERIRDRRD